MSSELGGVPALRAKPSQLLRKAPLGEVPWAFVDLETSGLDPAVDRIVEICIERVERGSTVRQLCEILRSDRWGAERIHGIRQSLSATAPPFEAVADDVERLLDDAVLVAHGAAQDVAFLQREFRRLKRSFQPLAVVDTAALARQAFPAERHGLHALCDVRAIPYERAHRAGHDVAALRRLWPFLIARLAPSSAWELVERSSSRAGPQAELLELARRAAASRHPVQVRYRPARGRPEWLEFCVTAVLTNLDPPRVLGYLQRSRGRRELYAHRIVAIQPLGEERLACED